MVSYFKSFLSPSAYYEFHAALGQFLNYREVLEEYEPSRLLYLAAPEEIYLTLKQRDLVLGFYTPAMREFSEFAVA